MDIANRDRRLLAEIETGLPLVPRPYAAVGARLQMSEAEVIARLRELVAAGVITRFGVIVRHRELGYRANAMVVWDVEDSVVAATGARMAAETCVTLCYRRPRRPGWPYNLFCMIHGTDRPTVLEQVASMRRDLGLETVPYAVLFSTRAYKQQGARYQTRTTLEIA